MGHSDITEMLNVYTHVQFGDARTELLRIAEAAPRLIGAIVYQRIYQCCREKYERIREDLRR